MVTDIGLIAVSIISLAGMILLFTLNNSTWFKKENWKMQKKTIMDENRIKMKRLEKELGLKAGSTTAYQEPKSTMDLAGDILPVLKNLSGDQIQGLADKFLNPEEPPYDAPESDITTTLLEYATKNPEMVKGLLEGFTKGKNEQTDIYE